MLFGRYYSTGRKSISCLSLSVSHVCTFCHSDILPHGFGILMFHLTQRSLRRTTGVVPGSSAIEEIDIYTFFFSHLSKTGKNLN